MSKPKILGLRTTIYRVPDLSKAKSFYGNAFSKEPYFDEPYYVGFNIGGYELGLQPLEVDAEPGVPTGITYWGVEDILKARDHFIAVGARDFELPQEVGGGIIVCSVYDPWGNAIGLIYNPHFILN